MTYEEAIKYIRDTAAFGSKLGLDNIRILMTLLGNPQDQMNIIHIAGTNGKGSVAAYLMSVLKTSGYRVGLYTSPELFRFSERIRIGDEEISHEDIALYASMVKEQADRMIREDMGTPTEFELVLAMALCYFRDKGTDAVILEVGLGGRLDATNVIDRSELSVITGISYDHMQYLGNTLEEIAAEKAAIIKRGGKVIVWPAKDSIMQVYRNVCKAMDATLHVADRPTIVSSSLENGQKFNICGREQMTRMAGLYETDNASLAIQAADILKDRFIRITEETISDGIAEAVWPGRFEVLKKVPLVIADGAHNADGAEALAACIRTYFEEKKVRFCMGILRDKQYQRMLEILLPYASSVIAVEVPNPRSLKAAELKAEIRSIREDLDVYTEDSVEDAAERIKKPQPEAVADIICGSLYLVGPLRAIMK
jgi:dihydrofolate synthase/folylpolyglutamate synthase